MIWLDVAHTQVITSISELLQTSQIIKFLSITNVIYFIVRLLISINDLNGVHKLA